MKWNKILLCIAFCMSALVGFSQNGTNTSGGTAQGENGSASFTIGQLSTNSVANANGKVQEGIQQVYQVEDQSSVFNLESDIECRVFPNPVAHQINVVISEGNTDEMFVKLFDVNGKIISNTEVTKNKFEIAVSDCKPGVYFLRISKKNIDQKVYKIVKN